MGIRASRIAPGVTLLACMACAEGATTRLDAGAPDAAAAEDAAPIEDAQDAPDLGPSLDSGLSLDAAATDAAAPDATPSDAGHGPPFSLRLQGQGYAGYEGRLVELRVVSFPLGQTLAEVRGRVEQGSFDFQLPDTLPAAQVVVLLWIDANADELCGANDPDLYRELLATVHEDLNLHWDFAEAEIVTPETCRAFFPHHGPHSLRVRGNGLDPGRDATFMLVQAQARTLRATLGAQTSAQGTVQADFRALLDEHTDYQLWAYLDRDGDQQCTAQDQRWTIPLPPAPRTTDVTIELSPASSSTTAEVCGNSHGPFALTFVVHGVPVPDPMQGVAQVSVNLRGDTGFPLIGSGFILFGDPTEARLPDVLTPDRGFHYCVCIQVGNGRCGQSSDAPTWTGAIPAPRGDQQVDLSLAQGTLSGCN
ncbi:MAG: hypothetical protein U1E65_15580 [Myxococcota bacterium]